MALPLESQLAVGTALLGVHMHCLPGNSLPKKNPAVHKSVCKFSVTLFKRAIYKRKETLNVK